MNPTTKKNNAYRHKQEIILTILNASRAPKTKTKIIYESMISSEQCNEYLEELINQGLLQYNQIKGTYISTTKGLKFIELYDRTKG
jgi:predicted transcriptional regulator